ncbi:MAG: SUMF1/EgtB/PvdO family nonheme iron enzyme [Planctomycetes bacterium]|nr:SUMF1/EgtB/PvdO family nonheme iron enzyme [Planctomycetota bacterium]MCB9871342.1 SUMF1/EgtB/PvdO family nonheme iron enzyme [Planctomycetota bacterium]
MTDRLEEALALYLTFDAQRESREEFLDRHDEFRDLLEPMFDDPDQALEPEHEDDSGRRLGDFRIVCELGRGGMGVVYEARQVSLDRRVALKVLAAHMTLHPTAVARFKSEALTAARLDHPNIVDIYSVGSEGDYHYFAMERVDGLPLDEHFAEPPDDPTELVRCLVQIAQALHSAHLAGVLHRDVKPSNILVGRDGVAKLTDFGLAREQGLPSLTATGEFAGTPYYVSPEQAVGAGDLDARTDVFSLGATMFELLTGHRPFEGSHSQEVLGKILRRDPVDPRQHNPRVPADLAAITLKALEKDRGRRYATAQALADDLKAFLGGNAVQARQLTRTGRVLRWARRNPLVAGLSTALAAFLIGGAAWILVQNAQLRETLRELRELSDIRVVSRLNGDRFRVAAARQEDAVALGAWLESSEQVVARSAQHRANLAELRARAEPYDPTVAARDRESHPDFALLTRVQRLIATGKRVLSELEGQPAAADRAGRLRRCREHIDKLCRLERDLEQRVGTRRTYTFRDTADQWVHDALRDLVDALDELEGEPWGTRSMVRRWRDNLLSAEQQCHHDHRGDWERVIAEVASDPRYAKLPLVPQFGLVPLGPDPESGLQEFAYPAAGAIPKRDARNRLVCTDDMALVFVLVPGGSFLMGAQLPDDVHIDGEECRDRFAGEMEGPVHEVRLEPFLLSKYEMTQAQWRALTGREPSEHRAGTYSFGRWNTLGQPVETIAWEHADEVLRQHGLLLPSEEQWEYAARAGTRTAWYRVMGVPRDFALVFNFADGRIKRELPGVRSAHALDDADDGYAGLAPIGSFPPNPFGFHEMLGNIGEWTGSAYHRYGAKSGHRILRVIRGGCFYDPIPSLRCSARMPYRMQDRASEFGVRPARALQVAR